MTLDDFRTVISAKMGMDNTVAGDQGLIDRWVNDGVIDVLVRTRVQVWAGSMPVTTGGTDYAIPTSIMAIEDMTITSGGSTYSLERVSPAEILDMRRNSAQSSPSRFYAVNGSQMLMLYPTPDNSVDTITVYYVPRPATLSAGSDTPSDIPAEFHKAIEYYALAQAADITDDSGSQDGSRYQQQYEAMLKTVKKAVWLKGGRRLSPAVVGHSRRRPYGRPDQQFV